MNHQNQEGRGGGPNPKRPKKSVEYDLICPITQELTVDPVTAEDGQVYERTAIEQYFDSKAGSEKVKSPIGMTSKEMGKKLLPAPRHRNTIEALIENGVISGDLADTWKNKMQQKKEFVEVVKKAEDGDAEAMMQVGMCYDLGSTGCKKDDSMAFKWYTKAHLAGQLVATACIGERLIRGRGAEQNVKKGACLLAFAAGKGLKIAAYFMGKALARGEFGFDVDVNEAQILLEQSLAEGPDVAGYRLSDAMEERAQQILDELSIRVTTDALP